MAHFLLAIAEGVLSAEPSSSTTWSRDGNTTACFAEIPYPGSLTGETGVVGDLGQMRRDSLDEIASNKYEGEESCLWTAAG